MVSTSVISESPVDAEYLFSSAPADPAPARASDAGPQGGPGAHGRTDWAERSTTARQRGARYPERESLFADFQPLVRRLIRQYGEDPELRQDLAGEIYYRFCNLVDAYDPSRGIPLRAYIVRTLTASVYTYSRSQWRRQHREVSLEADSGTVEPAESFIDPSSQWDTALMTQEVLNTLPEAIAQLPLRQRQVVIWRYYESRSFEEIAEMLQIRPATARSLLRHGLNNLRRKVSASPLAAVD
jgi:RNA polymerase sigma-70 factor (ECF subfamily)